MIGRHAHVPVAAGEGGDLLQHPAELLYPQRRGQLALRVVFSGVGPHRAVPSTEGNQSPAQPAGVQIDCHQPLFLQLRHPSYQRQDVDELRLRELPHSSIDMHKEGDLRLPCCNITTFNKAGIPVLMC